MHAAIIPASISIKHALFSSYEYLARGSYIIPASI